MENKLNRLSQRFVAILVRPGEGSFLTSLTCGSEVMFGLNPVK